MVNQGCVSLSTYYLEDGRHLVKLHRHCPGYCAYAPKVITYSHDNHEKINSWVSFSFLYGYGASLGGPFDRRSSAINKIHVYWIYLPGSFPAGEIQELENCSVFDTAREFEALLIELSKFFAITSFSKTLH